MADLTGMLQAAAGAAGGGGAYIEDVFSTYLYTGNGSTQTITNGIDLDGEGGMVWIKSRSAATNHFLFDTERGTTDELNSNTTDAEASLANSLTAFNSDGFSISSATGIGVNAATYASWTFRKATKFFDCVTYTGTGSARTVSHNLGSVPGCIIVKRTDTTGDWQVYHRANTANPETDYLVLNSTAATVDSNTRWNDTAPTDSVFTVGTEATVNASGGTYVAYLFAHDAGGFGDDSTENVISCGTFTTDGSSNATVNLGYEPQWILTKRTNGTGSWGIYDTMRGWAFGEQNYLLPDSSGAEGTITASNFVPTATGFTISSPYDASATYIYITIRRGPMKTPTSGTEVFNPNIQTNPTSPPYTSNYFAGFPVDFLFHKHRTLSTEGFYASQRLTAANRLKMWLTNAQENATPADWDDMDSITISIPGDTSATTNIGYCFRRAPGFFDVVCYTGTGSATTISHNLGVVPELIIIKRRSASNAWAVYAGDNTDYLVLNTTAATADDNTYWNDTSPTSTVFSVGTDNATNASTSTYVAYLFASLDGVSKIGTYTGNGSSVTVTTGFQPRFILVKRTDSTGNWIVGDSARGLVAGNDPYLLLNSTAAEDTDEDWVDVSATGFTVNETAANACVNNATYIYLCIS